MILNFPSDSKVVSLEFGFDSKNDPTLAGFYTLFDDKHPGVDFDLEEGSPIYASFSGVVVRKEFHKGMGNTLGIRNGNILALYAHLSEINVNLGDIVGGGDLIGKSGNTGMASTSPHLHFELRDLRFKNLREMVFKPEFEKEIKNFTESFIYQVNNTNTPKTLNLLSTVYFGTTYYVSKISLENNLNFSADQTLPQDLKIKIPNF